MKMPDAVPSRTHDTERRNICLALDGRKRFSQILYVSSRDIFNYSASLKRSNPMLADIHIRFLTAANVLQWIARKLLFASKDVKYTRAQGSYQRIP